MIHRQPVHKTKSTYRTWTRKSNHFCVQLWKRPGPPGPGRTDQRRLLLTFRWQLRSLRRCWLRYCCRHNVLPARRLAEVSWLCNFTGKLARKSKTFRDGFSQVTIFQEDVRPGVGPQTTSTPDGGDGGDGEGPNEGGAEDVVDDVNLPPDLQLLPDLGLPDIKWWVDLEFLDLASGPPANISSAHGAGTSGTNRNMKTPTFEWVEQCRSITYVLKKINLVL